VREDEVTGGETEVAADDSKVGNSEEDEGERGGVRQNNRQRRRRPRSSGYRGKGVDMEGGVASIDLPDDERLDGDEPSHSPAPRYAGNSGSNPLNTAPPLRPATVNTATQVNADCDPRHRDRRRIYEDRRHVGHLQLLSLPSNLDDQGAPHDVTERVDLRKQR